MVCVHRAGKVTRAACNMPFYVLVRIDGVCAQGLALASVQSAAESAQLAEVVAAAGVDVFWIGGKRIGTGNSDADWSWADGTEFTFANWFADEVSTRAPDLLRAWAWLCCLPSFAHAWK